MAGSISGLSTSCRCSASSSRNKVVIDTVSLSETSGEQVVFFLVEVAEAVFCV